ncbi:MAG: hypothetical protein A2157_04160 [Deltaproteobacteria bacterium RBG_16_47_11]|nr:MAG: hypothetical protein A2157_04160 [Deltaproteobacteria bacterium RBG_16_47_11]
MLSQMHSFPHQMIWRKDDSVRRKGTGNLFAFCLSYIGNLNLQYPDGGYPPLTSSSRRSLRGLISFSGIILLEFVKGYASIYRHMQAAPLYS